MKIIALALILFSVTVSYANPFCIQFYNGLKLKTGIPREQIISTVSNRQYDVLIIGGGSAGLGSGVDAATRGLKTVILEADDFASETSSKSTKLLHGGVRYLEQLWSKLLSERTWDQTLYNLIRDALHERETVIKNAPNLAHPLPLLTPIYNWPEVPYYWAGLKMYDILAGKKGKLPRSYFVSAKKIRQLYPQINSKNLKGGVVYYDGQFNDSRLAISLAQTATDHGASVLNHMRVIGFEKEKDRIIGVHAQDTLSGEIHTIKAKVILNATGPFADKLRQMDDPSVPTMISGASGTHLIVNKDFSLPSTGILIPKTSDGRVLFILPWEGKTIIGTTDSKADVVEKPTTLEADVDYLVKEVSQYLTTPINRSDVKSFWTGIRPLVSDPNAADTAQLARDHVINKNETSGLITLTGGKWTTYRIMGEHAVDQVMKQLGRDPQLEPSKTTSLVLSGSQNWNRDDYKALADKYRLDDDIALNLHRIYGSRASLLLDTTPSFHQRISKKYPFIWSEVFYAIKFESARSITDVLARRIRLATLDQMETENVLGQVGQILKQELNWSNETLQIELTKARAEFQIKENP
ncbi:MAG: FAD-dependent oxidoreductase [Bdellovibrionaceae bacterium]|nr:FAD-dependent oxidoreductase [Pseudobdellovibrionaceae bacterium]